MPLLAEEEKKDAAEAPGRMGRIGEVVGDEKDIDSDEEEELVDLPPEVAKALGEKVFQSEEELVEALETAGFGDLPVLLVNGNPRLKMPSDQHNTFTTQYAIHFVDFCKSGTTGRWGCCSGTHKIHLPHGKSRHPDLSYWGYPRCSANDDGPLFPANRGSIPDVIIQFSWKNTRGYEEDAIDDMMNNGLEKDHGPLSMTHPRVGYLIKVKFSKKRTLAGAIKGSRTQDLAGLRIFRLKHGTTINDAESGSSPDAEAWDYFPGGPERFIVISPQDLGISGMWALLFGEYKIRMSKVFQDMKEYHMQRQSDGLAT